MPSKDTQVILKKLRKIDNKLNRLSKADEELRKEQKLIEADSDEIERALFTLGKFTFKRQHFMELVRGTAGSFLGVGISRNLLLFEPLAATLPWENIVAIFLFVALISYLLIYKNERHYIQQGGLLAALKRILFLYFVSLVVEVIALGLFSAIPEDTTTLIKLLVIGSYAAMAGAVSFSLI